MRVKKLTAKSERLSQDQESGKRITMNCSGKSTLKAEFATVKDIQGHKNTHYLIKDTDILLPPFPGSEERFEELPRLEARSDDVLICGYPKCGTHWIWEIVGMLIRGEANYIPAIKESVMVEAVRNRAIDSIPSPRVLNSHLPVKYIPGQFFEKKSKIVYLLRNPKDMLVSFYNHTVNLLPFYGYEGTWNGFFDLFMQGKVDYGDWFRYVLEWEAFITNRPDLPIHVLYYEDMKKDPVREINKLTAFLGKSVEPELSAMIAEKCSFKNMKKAKSAFDDDIERADWKDGKPMMYRKGEVGDWKNWFTVAQEEALNEMIRRKLTSSKLKFTYVL